MTTKVRTVRLLVLLALASAFTAAFATAGAGAGVQKKPTRSAVYRYHDGEWVRVAATQNRHRPVVRVKRYRYRNGEWIAVG